MDKDRHEHTSNCDGSCEPELQLQLATVDEALNSLAHIFEAITKEWRIAAATTDASDYAKATFLLKGLQELREIASINIPLLELGVEIAAAKLRDQISRQN